MNLIFKYTSLFFEEVWSLSIEAAPYLLFGMLFAGFISIFIDSRLVVKHIGEKSLSSIFKSTIFGVPAPLCSCGVIPVAATLRESGASKGSTVSFLVSTPQTGVDSIILTYGMLGPAFAIFRPLAAFFSGLISGTIVNAFDDETHHHNISNKSNLKEKNEPFKDRLLSGLKYGFINLPGDIAVPLVQGLFVAAIISIFLPPDFVAEYFVSSQYLAYFAMLLISLPMYVCATASIPIALALMGKGVTAGAVFIFLMAGPATNASSVIVVKNILGTKTMYQYLFLISGLAILFGSLLDLFFDITLPTSHLGHHTHEMDGLGSIIIAIIFILILLHSYIHQKFPSIFPTSKKSDKTKTQPKSVSYNVSGMTCSHCKDSVESAASSINGVDSTHVDLSTGVLTVVGNSFDDLMLKQKIKDRGFEIN